MYRVRALLLVIALAATACSTDSETVAEAEAPTSTETTEAEAPTTTATAETGGESIVIESDVDFATAAGTFTVDEGAELLGCSSGSLAQRGGPQGPHGVTNTFICEDGDRQGTFTFAWKIIDGAKGPGTDNGLWSVLATTGDFAGLTGDGLGSGVVDGDTATMSFPGAIEYGAVGAAAEPIQRSSPTSPPTLWPSSPTTPKAHGTACRSDAKRSWTPRPMTAGLLNSHSLLPGRQ